MLTLLAAALMLVQAQAQGWFEQNSGIIIAIIAILGTAVQGYMGTRQKRTPTGEAQLDDERAYRLELRTENRDLRTEKVALEDENDVLRAKNRELDNQVGVMRDAQEKHAALVKELQAQIAEKDLELKTKNATIQRLNTEITVLKANGNGH